MDECIKNIDSTTIAALIGVIGALIAAIIGVIGTLIVTYFTKKQRLGIEVKSKHRQDWINSLRKDISLICTKSNYINYDLREILRIDHIQGSQSNKTFSEYIHEYGQIDSSHFSVKLFLNPKENDHIELDNEITHLKDNLKEFINYNLKPDNQINSDDYSPTRKKIENNIVKITELAQKIFKDEWERIKRGE